MRMRHCMEGDGYIIEWDSENDGYARIVVKSAASADDEAARRWLPPTDWYSYEFSGDDAFELALKAALNAIWPERAPYRIA